MSLFPPVVDEDTKYRYNFKSHATYIHVYTQVPHNNTLWSQLWTILIGYRCSWLGHQEIAIPKPMPARQQGSRNLAPDWLAAVPSLHLLYICIMGLWLHLYKFVFMTSLMTSSGPKITQTLNCHISGNISAIGPGHLVSIFNFRYHLR